jgi:hydroxymethylpyrimidine pyrophosphatase-like HAD family hydrolase
VNGWFGDYDKLTMAKLLFEEVYRETLAEIKNEVIFIGDSPNDAPMFAYFPNSVGVANFLQFKEQLSSKPAWVTRKEGGHGFAEMVALLLGN